MQSSGRDTDKHNNENIDGRQVEQINKRKVLYVHVGKTGGETIHRHYLNNLANLHSQQLHVHALDHQMIQDFKPIIISMRNPVDRLISAYRWSHPLIEGSRAYTMKQEMNPFYKCCPTLRKFGEVLFESNRTACGVIARSQSLRTVNYKNHINLDLCAYVGGEGIVSSLEKKKWRVFIINTESLESDFNHTASIMKWTVQFKTNSSNYFGHSLKRQSNEEVVSDLTRQKFRKYLELTGEMDMYDTLRTKFGFKRRAGQAS